MILYRKAAPLRIRRAAAPEPPFWCATTIAPYAGKRGSPVAIDYLASRATASGERSEVTVSENVREELERTRINHPVLIDATEAAETVFRRGEEALAVCEYALYLTSTRGALPRHDAVIAIAAWPLDLPRLEQLFERLRPSPGASRHPLPASEARGTQETPGESPSPRVRGEGARRADEGRSWGVVIPVIYPITTDLAALDALAERASAHHAQFFAAMPVDVDATAKQAIANELQLSAGDDRYAMLFHADAAPIHLATERHVAALAHAHGMRDFVTPPRFEERTNWNAAALLTLIASRMIAMELDLDLAGLIARSARAVAELDKPVARVAEAASLSIIEALDETSAEMLAEWLEGREPSFGEYVNEQWRLSRSSGAPPSPSC